ncbi:MAG: penicillin acylase family protein [Bacteroidota bacterium]
MKSILLSFGLWLTALSLSAYSPEEIARWQAQADQVTILRDSWGIPHVYGKTDADAVFGMLYVQCEDDFARVERNYLDATGQMALAYGEEYLYHDLRARFYIDSLRAKAYYQKSPAWLKKLCDAFADGINYYLYTHPAVKPDYLTRFEPWMPFSFSEGSIGGDITRISLSGLKAFYGKQGSAYIEIPDPLAEAPTGSNGFSIAPEKSATGNALFLINPHTSFYFRSEMQVSSDEGLQAYGAVTWGQFFIYQGFNEACGWMHTSTRADAIDQYLETILKQGDGYKYKYGADWRPVREEKVSIPYREDGKIKEKAFTLYFTHHGPIIRSHGDQWVSFRMMDRPVDALKQSFLRTKAQGYKDFMKSMKIRTNSSNNTVYADRDGTIAYWHGNFIPSRNPAFDYNGLIDGSNPATDWGKLHKVKELIHVKDPASGWIQNCNATPYTVAGQYSPEKSNYPDYVAPDRENFRGINAVRVLDREHVFTLDKLIEAANDPVLAFFEKPIPALIKAYEKIGDPQDAAMKEAIELLRAWNFHYGEESVGTALGVYWEEKLKPIVNKKSGAREARNSLMWDEVIISFSTDEEKVAALRSAMDHLEKDFGNWKTPWGEINRFQRLTGKIQETYDDEQASIPVGFTSSLYGSLAAYWAVSPAKVVRRYGRGGNSFVAVVEFGEKVIARSVVSGGQAAQPDSPHFTDQAALFCKGQFKEVYFYRDEVEAHLEKSYKPGK